MQFTINLADTLIVESRGIEAELDVTKLVSETIARLTAHGAWQKISDAASGATAIAVRDKFGDKAKPADHKPWLQSAEAKAAIAAHTKTLMDKAARGLEAGEWSQRGSGGAVDEATLVQRIVTKAAYKAQLGGESAAWKDFIALDKGAQNEKLDGIWAKNEKALAPAFATEMKIRKARKAKPAVTLSL